LESLEITAKTVNEAIAKALALLGRDRSEVDVSVLSEGARGIFGIGGEDARILVSVHGGSVQANSEAPSAEAVVDEHPVTEEPTGDAVEVAHDIVQSLLDAMGIEANVDSRPPEAQAAQDGFVAYIDITGDDLGLLIGRRGESLSALQFVTNLMLGKRMHRYTKVQVDIEGYRVRREQSLRTLAHRMAARAAETGMPVALEAMPASERRIVHLTLQNSTSVQTQSEGEGEHRRVVISPRA
jgi:spoIIIJ-associated protein